MTDDSDRIKLSEQVDQQFSNLIPLSTDPSTISTPTPLSSTFTSNPHSQSKSDPIGQPRIRRVTREEASKKNPAVRHSLPITDEDSDDEEDTDMVMPAMVQPLQVVKVATHDGSVQHQELEDTSNVVVGDRLELLGPKGRPRKTIENFWDSIDSSSEAGTSSQPQPQPLSTQNKTPSVQVQRSTPAGLKSEMKSRSSQSPNELLALRVRALLLANFNK